jgi:hypothetical protein
MVKGYKNTIAYFASFDKKKKNFVLKSLTFENEREAP